MDLSKIRTNETIEIEIFHPTTGESTDIIIEAYTTDSKFYKRLLAELRNRRIGKRITRITAERADAESLELLAKCVKSWENVKRAGEDLECTFENVLAVFKEHPWLFDQVDTEIADRKNFLSDASSN